MDGLLQPNVLAPNIYVNFRKKHITIKLVSTIVFGYILSIFSTALCPELTSISDYLGEALASCHYSWHPSYYLLGSKIEALTPLHHFTRTCLLYIQPPPWSLLFGIFRYLVTGRSSPCWTCIIRFGMHIISRDGGG
jgi:hypothetical protein